jgi:hypothetical protein
MWFIRRSNRAPADGRRRHVRPALEALESRVVPASGFTTVAPPAFVPGPGGGQAAAFNQGAAFATMLLNGASAGQHLAVDTMLIKFAQDGMGQANAQLHSPPESEWALIEGVASALWTAAFDMGILSVAVPDFFASLNRGEPTTPFGPGVGFGLGGGGLGGGFQGGGGLGGVGFGLGGVSGG